MREIKTHRWDKGAPILPVRIKMRKVKAYRWNKGVHIVTYLSHTNGQRDNNASLKSAHLFLKTISLTNYQVLLHIV